MPAKCSIGSNGLYAPDNWHEPAARADPGCPDWRRAEDYEILLHVDRRAFAWEWLRRTGTYRVAWQRHREGVARPQIDPRRFGLERFEDATLGAPRARPIWTMEADPGVLKVKPIDLFAADADRLDLHRLNEFVTVMIDEDGDERLLLSDGRHFVRLDVVEGTLIGSPCSLLYMLEGAASARERFTTVLRLIDLIERDGFPVPRPCRSNRQTRWVAELRVADALQAGANQQDIARVLFGNRIPDTRWRIDAPAYRRRIQRLVTKVKARQRSPVDPRWFRTPSG